MFGATGLAVLLIACYEPNFTMLSFCCLLAGELMERAIFFKAVVAPKMPGGVQV